VGTGVGTTFAGLASASLDALRALQQTPSVGFDLRTPLATLIRPDNLTQWVTLGTVLLFGIVCGLGAAALPAARRGIRPSN
jgi:hypothetical protein